MIYNTFGNNYSMMGNQNTFSSSSMLGRLPTYTNFQTQLFGPTMRSSGFGMSGLRPEEARQAQAAELQRLQGIQGLQTGAFQQQMAGLQTQEAAMGFQEAQRRRGIEQAIEQGPSAIMQRNPNAYRNVQDPYQAAIATDYGKQLLQERRMRELELEKAEFEGQAYRGGGFTSWSTPVFPMMR